MSRPISTDGGAVTVALSVATLTEAVTSGISQSFFSRRAAQAAHVMPRIESSTSLTSGADVLLVTAADDIHPCFPHANHTPVSPMPDDSVLPNHRFVGLRTAHYGMR